MIPVCPPFGLTFRPLKRPRTRERWWFCCGLINPNVHRSHGLFRTPGARRKVALGKRAPKLPLTSKVRVARRGLTNLVAAPAGDGAVRIHPAGVETPGADRRELAARRCGLDCLTQLQTPAGDGAVRLHPAGVVKPPADRGELPARRRGLTNPVAAPAGDGAVRLQPAGVETPGADRGELPARRHGLAVLIAAPAGNGAVRLQPAGVETPSADRRELAARRRGLTVLI